MRTYQRRYLGSEIQKISNQSLEIKNGIIWRIDTTSRQCEIKMLGSTDMLKATFPPSHIALPNWARRGAAVHLRYRYGLRNALEIVGPGHIIPAPTTGTTDEYTPTIDTTSLDECVLSGCKITEIDLDPQMGVMIQTGSVRIDRSTVDVEAIKMDSTFYKMDMGGKMNDVAAVIQITTATTAAAEMRNDLFVVGKDAVIDKLSATFQRTASTETLATYSTYHLQLGKVLIPANTTIIRNSLIDKDWSSAHPVALKMTFSATRLYATVTTASIEIQVLDQYNNTYAGNLRKGWRLELEIANVSSARGFLQSSEGTATSVIGAYAGTAAGATFTYLKQSTFPTSTLNVSPILTGRLIEPLIERNESVLNLNTTGQPITTANN